MNKQTHVEPETRHILPFLAWTFGITWGAWLLQYILTALKLTSGAEPLGLALNFIGGFGPALGTFISLKISHPKKMLDFIFSHAKGWWIYMLAFCLVRVLTLFIANPALPPLNAILMFPLGWTFITFAGGGNEELGWRGVLQPALEKKFSFPLATVITALVWVAWHLPLWLIPERVKVRFLCPSISSFVSCSVSVWRFSTSRRPLSLPAWSFTAALTLLRRRLSAVLQMAEGISASRLLIWS